ncbi:MAG: hypothetical protein AB8F65_02825 [Woeseiaceae bacterium]
MKHHIFLRMLVIVMLLSGCGAPDSEQQIRDLIKTMAKAAEDEELRPIARAISDDYRDLRDNDKASIVQTMRGVMFTTNGLLILPDIQKIEIITENFAEVSVRVRFAGADWERLRLRGSSYLFELELAKDGSDWLVVSARWAPGDGEPR